MKSVLANKPEIHFPQCFSDDRRPYIKTFPKLVDPYICATYEAIQQLPESPAANTLISQLVRFGVVFVGIVTFEGGRQSSFWLKQSDLYLFIAQATSGAAAIPAYFAAIHENQSSHVQPPTPRPEHAWASLLALSIGYILPIAYGSSAAWRGNALIIFLFYPVFMWVIRNLVLTLLRSQARILSYKVPLVLQGLFGMVVSAGDQVALYRGYTLDQVLRPSLGINLVQDLHAMLLADFVITAVALASHVILYSYGGESVTMRLGVIVAVLLLSAVFGPGSAISVAWVYGEVWQNGKSVVTTRTARRTRIKGT